MSDDELFPPRRALSPRLAWMKRHMLVCIAEDPELLKVPIDAEPDDQVARFYCMRDDGEGLLQTQALAKIGRGDTEDDACLDYAQKNGLRSWQLEVKP